MAIEVAVFWWAGPPADPKASLLNNLVLKSESASAWTAVGFAALSMTWLFVELASLPYSHGRRLRRFVAHETGEELVYDTGLHWLVLLRDLHTGELNDGNEDELNEPLIIRDKPLSVTWYFVWIPMLIATLTALFFVGWIGWLTRNFPNALAGWCDGARSFVTTHLSDGFAFLAGPINSFLAAIPIWLTSLSGFARDNTFVAVAALLAIWIVLRVLRRMVHGSYAINLVLRVSQWLVLVAVLFAVFANESFDWVAAIYTFLPNNGPVSMGFAPLIFTIAVLPLHVILWSSWRYGITRDSKSHDATLVFLGGVLNFDKREFQLERIVDTHIHQKWWQRLLGVGDIEVIEVGGGKADLVTHIAGPNRLDRIIKDAIRDRRRRSAGTSE